MVVVGKMRSSLVCLSATDKELCMEIIIPSRQTTCSVLRFKVTRLRSGPAAGGIKR